MYILQAQVEVYQLRVKYVNVCVAYGGWVPRNLGAGAADHKPR